MSITLETSERRDDLAAVPTTVLELFAAHARARPEASAASAGGVTLSYGELDARSRHLARRLRHMGIGPDSRVGIYLGRSVEALVAVLGVLEAGGAWVPIDPSYPDERIAWMLADARLDALVSTARHRAALPVRDPDLETVFLDTDQDEGRQEKETRSPISPDQLAYVIYTSGSTGRPKGVLVSHRGLGSAARTAAELAGVTAGSRVLQGASFSFDASVLEIFIALTSGAELQIVDPATLYDGAHLASFLEERRTTSTFLIPSVLAHLAAAAPERDFPCLSGILTGAEACTAPVAAHWAPGRRFVNLYGPTEATIFATAQPLQGSTREAPPLGSDVAGMGTRVLDSSLAPSPSGETGEIFLNGPGLARGYHGRPGLTAERFLPDPYADRPGQRLYRTGDLGRRRPDGALDFAGRADRQVKLRGFRIELGEIEAALGEHPAVSQAVVDVRQPGPRLLAWVTPTDAHRPPTPEDLREHMARHLPRHMVPAAFAVLQHFPRTPSGKVDPRALQPPEAGSGQLGPRSTTPRTELEARVAATVCELLGLAQVGVDDDLVELGAHSLVFGRLVNRLGQELGCEIALAKVIAEPTVAAVARRVAASRRQGSETHSEIRPASREGDLPLSFPQERIWFLDRLTPGQLAYNVQLELRFQGPLDPGLLARSYTEIVRRHEMLRTTFPEKAGTPVQRIHPPYDVELPLVDLEALPEDRREETAQTAIDRFVCHRFDLERLPLIRLALFRYTATEHLLLQMEHHLVHDGWSLAVLFGELKACYAALRQGRRPQLPALPIQYADFAVWQREWMSGERLRRGLDFWRRQMAGSPPLLELPADRPRPLRHGFRGRVNMPWLPSELYTDLRRFSRHHGVSLFTTMLTAFTTLLHRYTGQVDIVLGSGVANRRRPELETLIGMVINTVLIRSDLSGRPSFRELLERTYRTMLEVHDHQDVPFGHVVTALQPERGLDHNPLFQVMFAFHDSAVPELDFGDVTGGVHYRHNYSAKADLIVIGVPRREQKTGQETTPNAAPGEMYFIWEHNAEILDRSTLVRMWRHYLTLLRAIVEEPDLRIDAPSLLGVAERQQVLGEWSGSAAGPPVETVPRRLAAQVERRRTEPAVVGVSEELSYDDLEQRSSALAARLRELGVAPGEVVGVYARRSPALIAGLLAIWKAGGAYLPVDPALPPARRDFLLADAGVDVLLTETGLEDDLATSGRRVLRLDSVDATHAPAAFDEPIPPDRLAYVIYTSGSTGEPKGVEIEHAALSRLVDWHLRCFALSPEDRVTHLAGLGFDASVWEIWPALCAGARLEIPSEEVRLSPEALCDWLRERRVTVSFLPTPLAESALDLEWPADTPLRYLLTGGDRLRRRPAPGLPFTLVNNYGPTENTVVSTSGPVTAAATARAPSIGRPIDGVVARVLDRSLRPVPTSVPGELVLGGSSLGRGYRGRPATTAAAFVPDPWSDRPGGRLYRTGDIVRWLADGEIDFVGRVDAQVKIRGFRIELGEIETLLAAHPAVHEAAVAAFTPLTSDRAQALAAYVSCAETVDFPEELRRHLADRLPAYMIPASWVQLDRLPLTEAGKVDRRALPEPEPTTEQGFVAPRDPEEETLAELWRDVLGRERVGVYDDFFTLGGHSLLAMRLLAEIGLRVGVEIPVQKLFERPTVAALAEEVRDTLQARELLEEPSGDGTEEDYEEFEL